MGVNVMSRFKKGILLVAIIFLLIFTMGYLMVNVWDPDFWWHLATGRWIVEHGKLPDKDPFSFTTLHSDPFFPVNRVKFILTQYWLAQVIMYKIYSLWGYGGIGVFRALMLTLSLGMLVLLLRYHRIHPSIILLSFIAGLLIIGRFTNERPQLFSTLFSAVLLYILERAKNERPWIAVGTIPLMILWSNLHGGYIYGGFIILIYILSGWLRLFFTREKDFYSERKKHHIVFTLILLCSMLSSFINPNTFYAYVNAFEPKILSVGQFILEYKPIYVSYKNHIVFSVLTVVTTILMLVNIKRLGINDVFLFLFNIALSFSASRYIVFFAVYGSFLFGKYLSLTIHSLKLERKRYFGMATLVLSLMILIGYIFFYEHKKINQMFRHSVLISVYPFEATEFIKKTLYGKKLFNPYSWGGFIIWKLYPDPKVFIDGRNLNPEVFLLAKEVMSADSTVIRGGKLKWKAILDGYEIDYIFIAPYTELVNGVYLTKTLIKDKDWQLIYSDDNALIFIRDKDEFREIIKKYSLPKDFAYSVIAAQTFQAATRAGEKTSKKEIVTLYIVAGDAFLKLQHTRDAKFCFTNAYKIDPVITKSSMRRLAIPDETINEMVK